MTGLWNSMGDCIRILIQLFGTFFLVALKMIWLLGVIYYQCQKL